MIKEQLLEVLADEILSAEFIADCAIKYMCHADIEDMLHTNEIGIELGNLFDAIDDGLVSNELVAECAIRYMSNDDVVDMLHVNEILDLDASLIWS
jgi:hypothetical protein